MRKINERHFGAQPEMNLEKGQLLLGALRAPTYSIHIPGEISLIIKSYEVKL